MSKYDALFTDKVNIMQPYHVASSSGMIKLDSMESPYRLPQEMQKALGTILSMSNLNRYPNSKSTSLVAKIKSRFDIPDSADLLMGNGSDELIQIVITALAKPGAVVLAPVPTFVMYQQTAELLGMKFVGVDCRDDFSVNEDEFLSAIDRHQPAVIFLAYPNNPTGFLLDKALVKKILATAPGLVVLDEAYAAYAGDDNADLLNQYDNVVLIRTLSKIGLAGIRLGYMAANSELMRQFEKVRMPYNINVLTQSTARFVLDQMTFLDECVSKILTEKQVMFDWLSQQPHIEVYPSATNFLLVRVSNADEMFVRLRDEYKILIKNLHGYHPILNNILRITIGRKTENDKLRIALAELLSDGG